MGSDSASGQLVSEWKHRAPAGVEESLGGGEHTVGQASETQDQRMGAASTQTSLEEGRTDLTSCRVGKGSLCRQPKMTNVSYVTKQTNQGDSLNNPSLPTHFLPGAQSLLWLKDTREPIREKIVTDGEFFSNI